MPYGAKPAAPEQAAPPIVSAFISEFAYNVDNLYAILKDDSDDSPRSSLFDLQMETLIFGLHCLDRAVFAYWGADYRAAFMNCAFGLTCEIFADKLPESAREKFLAGYKQHCDTRQAEYGTMNLRETTLAHEFASRICLDADVYNPAILLALTEWASGIPTMMLKVAEAL